MAREKKQAAVGVIVAVIFAILILSSIVLLRVSKGYLPYPNGEAYYNLRIVGEIEKNILFFDDTLQDRPYHSNTFQYITASLMKIVPEKIAIFIPVLFGVLLLLFLYRLLVTLNIHGKNASFSLLILCVSPIFIIAFSSLNRLGFALMLSITALSLFFEKNYWESPWLISGKIYFALSILSLCLLATTSFVAFAITLVLMVLICAVQGRNFQSLGFAGMIPFLIIIPLSVYTEYLSVSMEDFALQAPELRQFFSVLGSNMGIDIFLLILFITGLIILWNFIKELRIYHFLVFLLVILSSINPLLRFYATILICPYCVVAIKHLYYRKWELDTIKTGTILLVVCALLFSVLNQVNSLVREEPGPDAIAILDALKDQQQGIVMAEPEYGSLIEYYASKRVMLDESSRLYPNYHETLGDYEYMLGLTRLKDASPMLDKHNIRYIIISPYQKEERWSGKEKQFLLLLKNSDAFRLIHATESGFELWRYERVASAQQSP